MSEQGCPNKDCSLYGSTKRCWKHCNRCGADILWKPKGMDFNVKYEGPKPLDLDSGKKHTCSKEGMEAVEDRKHGYSYQLAYFLHNGYPALAKHYTKAFYRGTGIQQPCGDPKCPCANVEDMRWKTNPEQAAQWNKERAEWLKQWDQAVDYGRFRNCTRCNRPFKLFPYNRDDKLCSPCYWEEQMEKGIPFTPLGFDYGDVEMSS